MSELTPAEHTVAVHLVQGLGNKEIAALLNKAEPTTSEVRVWMTLREPAPPELMDELGKIPWMHRVRSHGPGHDILEKLLRPPA